MFRKISSGVKKFWASIALLSVEIIIVLVLFVGALAIFVFVAGQVFIEGNTEFDKSVTAFLHNYVSDRVSSIMMFFTFLGTHNFLIPANLTLAAFFLFFKKHRWHSILIPAISLSSLGLMALLKNLFNRPRPDIPLLYEAKGLSFPSGHALLSVTFYGLLIYIVYKNVQNKVIKWIAIVLLLLLIITIGFTRIYLNVHYATDVIAGFCVGFLWLVFSVWLLRKLERKSQRKLDAVVTEPVPGEQKIS
ncbi:MAG: phosphatase PAP2 family protein [Bacteroidota bacterium]